MIQCILYDLDGVLVDACDWHYDALNKALLEVCGFKIGRREHAATFNGLPTKNKLQILKEQGRLPETLFEQVHELKQRHTLEIINELKPDPIKIELHQKVTELDIKIACVTNSVSKTAETMLAKTGQRAFMSLVISNEDVVHSKPCGEGYIVAMVNLKVEPRRALIVEDSPKGLAAAHSTGAQVLQVANAAEVTWDKIRGVLE